MYEITLNGGCRTNNICEGWNHSFNSLVGQQHPPLYKMIESLQKDYALVKAHLAKSNAGIPYVNRVRREYAYNQRNMQMLCRQYQVGIYNNNVLGYLARVSYNIRF